MYEYSTLAASPDLSAVALLVIVFQMLKGGQMTVLYLNDAGQS